MVTLDAQIAHFKRRLKAADELADIVGKDAEKQEQKLARLESELESIQKAASAAQGFIRFISTVDIA
jgi:ABC-type Fe3+-citrate transport system substrate-binding protein